jgi:hypothetical protein
MQAYNKTDQELHLLSQTIAKANCTYVPSKEDDSHTNLYFDAENSRIEGRWINNGTENLMLTLNLDTLQFAWLNEAKECIKSVTTIGRTVEEIENEVAVELAALKLNPTGFTDDLHFEITKYPFAKMQFAAISQADLSEWKSYRHLANELCTKVLENIQLESEIRIWPHHFDTGIYVKLQNKIGLGFGLAMEDSMAGASYFYMSGYPEQGSLDFDNLPELISGRWETGEYWQGAILPLTILKNGIYEENKRAIDDYLLKSLDWFSGYH